MARGRCQATLTPASARWGGGSFSGPAARRNRAAMDDLSQAHEPALDTDGNRRLRQRDKKKRQRAAMTDEMRQSVQARDAERHRRRRAAMSESEREADRVANAERYRRRRAALSEEETAAKRNKDAARRRRAWASPS